jgi:hypothetical protein
MRRIVSFCSISAIGLLLNGCATVPYQGQAHDIKRRPQEEGVVGIPVKFRDEDRAKAEQHMQSNCGQLPYKILEEGEVAIGEETKTNGKETDRASNQRKVGSIFGMPVVSGEAAGKNTESSQVTTSVKEWQISYKCLAGNESGKKSKTR